jgi:hypothetical protein
MTTVIEGDKLDFVVEDRRREVRKGEERHEDLATHERDSDRLEQSYILHMTWFQSKYIHLEQSHIHMTWFQSKYIHMT